jgi:hypothetical protein
MFRTRGLTFWKVGIRFYVSLYKQSTHKAAYTDACKSYLLDFTCTYNRLPEHNKPSISKSTIKEIKIKPRITMHGATTIKYSWMLHKTAWQYVNDSRGLE